MGNQSQDCHLRFNSSVSWSPDEESTFLDMLVEEFINKQPEAMDALIALVLFRISKITDEGWNRVAIRLTNRIGKKYTMMELKEQMKRFTRRFQCMENLFGQGGPGMNFPPTTFEPYSDVENDTRGFKSPDEDVPIPEKDATNSDGCNVSVPYPEDCVGNSNGKSDNVSFQEGDIGMGSPRTTLAQSFEHENHAGISKSPDENVPTPEKDAMNSDGCNVSVGNSNRNSDNVSFQEGDLGMDSPRTTLEQSFEWENDAGISTPPDRDVPTSKKDARNSDGCNVSIPHPEDCERNSNCSSDNDSLQEGDFGMDSPCTSFEQSFGHENDAGISWSPEENLSIPETEGKNSNECKDSIQYPEESVKNSEISQVNVSYQESGPGLDFSCATFGAYFEHDNDAGVYWTPDVSHQEDGSGMDSPHATPEPYFEHYNDAGVYWTTDENFPYPGDCATNFNRSSDSSSHQNDGPGIRTSPIEKLSIPEKEGRNSDGCKGSVPYIDGSLGKSNRSYGNVTHQADGFGTSFPRTEFEPSDEHDNDAGICQSPVESVSIPEKDSRNSVECNDSFPYPEESVRKSNRSCNGVLPAHEDIIGSGVNPNVSYPRERENATEKTGESEVSRSSDAEKNWGHLTAYEIVSSPSVDVESVNQWNDPTSGQEENVTSSTPRYEDCVTPEYMGCNKRPAADPLDSSDYCKRNKWSSYSQPESTRGDNQNSDDGDSFSFARCRNILHGMRRIESRFRDTALELLEDQPYYRKFFMQTKYDKRLDWLSSILGMEH